MSLDQMWRQKILGDWTLQDKYCLVITVADYANVVFVESTMKEPG